MNTNVLEYGAVSDGKTLCTSAIQSAIDACADTGGGRVTLPAGNYLSGSIWLRDNVELHLEHGCVLKGSSNMDDYNAEDAYPQNFSSRNNEKWLGKHLIIAHECTNVALTGYGVIDGSADSFMSDAEPYSSYVWVEGCRTAKDDEILRPGQLVVFIECSHVRVENITTTNQPCWGCFFHGCEYVSVRGLKAINGHANFNSDGIDIDCCRYVTVSDCILDTGDDAIAIRGSEFRLKNKPHPCEFITISNCVLGSSSCGIRIGVGDGIIRHVRISNLTVTRAAPLLSLMSSYHGHGHVSIEDVSITNVSAVNCTRAFDIVEEAGVPIKNVVLENFYVETYGYFDLHSNSENAVSNIRLKDWRVVMKDGPAPLNPRDYQRKGTVWFRARNIDGLVLENIAVEDDGEYIKAWENGTFSFDGGTPFIANNVTLNGIKAL